LQLVSEAGVRQVNATMRLDSVARALDVGTVIVSTLERAGDSLAYDVRLVDARSLLEKTALRGRWYSEMVVSMRDTVALAVSTQLLQTIGREVQAYAWQGETKSTRAWELRQRALDLQQFADELPTNPKDFSPQLVALASAESLLVRAASDDPAWEEPVVGRGWVLLRRAKLLTGPGQRAAIAAATAVADTVSRRWVGSPRALELRGAVHFEAWRNLPHANPLVADSAESELRAATNGDPKLARAWITLSDVLRRKGDSSGSDLAARRALEADGYGTLAGSMMTNLFFRQMYRRQFDSARTICDLARSRFASDPRVQSCHLTWLGWSGAGHSLRDIRASLIRTEQSGAFALEAGMFPVGRLWVAAVLARSRMIDSARVELASIQQRLRDVGLGDNYAMNEAQVLLLMGNRDSAFARLRAAVALDPTRRPLVASLPWFDPIRDDPRMAEVTPRR
jgi:hypothetical protein